MNRAQNRQQERRRIQNDRRVTLSRQYLFDTIRSNTVSYAHPPLRRASRQVAPAADIDNPAMTRLLQFGILLVMIATLVMFRAPLLAALLSVLPPGIVGV